MGEYTRVAGKNQVSFLKSRGGDEGKKGSGLGGRLSLRVKMGLDMPS